MKILITGGAGYIGSTVANLFLDKNYHVSIIDNLSTGSKKNIPKQSNFYHCDISNVKKIKKILKKKFDIVLHFAAYANSEDSVKYPQKYFNNNYKKSVIFLNLCKEFNIKNYIFSSTAAVYGHNKKKIKETQNFKPMTPYAKSKLKLEKFFFKNKNKLNFIILRYFNVGGAEKRLRCGFNIKNKSLISNLCKSFFDNKKFFIFGNTYPTKDGTAIRDYIHVEDLAKIHFRFSLKMIKKNYSEAFNCGYGKGISVKKMYSLFLLFSKNSPGLEYIPKRKKDISISISDIKKLSNEININYGNHKLRSLVRTSIDWYEQQINELKKN